MYHFTYSKVVAEGSQTTRAAEREVLLQSVELMEQAELAGAAAREAIDAVYFVSRLWCHFIEDLGSPDNHLPNDIRARLISIGLFMIRRADSIRNGSETSFRGMIDITRTVAEGLK